MAISKLTEEQLIKVMKQEGLSCDDVSQYYRICFECNHYVSVDDQSENICDDCNN